MKHFGAFLKELRERRGLTQAALAERARTSDFTIQRGEKAKTNPWKRSTALDVLKALEAAATLSQEEAEQYLTATGLHHGMAVTRQAVESVRRDERARPRLEALVNYLLECAGDDKLLAALQGIAAAWSMPIPPDVAEGKPTEPLRWRLISAPVEEEGYIVQRHEPIEPPAKPRAGRLPQRRAE